MSDATAPTVRRPVLVTLVVAVIYVVGFFDAAIGVLVLLGRYDMKTEADVIEVSLLGAGIVLFGLLLVAVAAGVGHGSNLSRILVTVYSGVQSALHITTIVTTDWDWAAIIGLVLQAGIIVVLWTPPGSHYFRDARRADAAAQAPVAADTAGAAGT
jgi:holin-like protein